MNREVPAPDALDPCGRVGVLCWVCATNAQLLKSAPHLKTKDFQPLTRQSSPKVKGDPWATNECGKNLAMTSSFWIHL
uniref:Uncharacterized protein n=1 Tax=Globodera rostochiensis TaxID=31243 RepID=A0A914HPU6_GLORO